RHGRAGSSAGHPGAGQCAVQADRQAGAQAADRHQPTGLIAAKGAGKHPMDDLPAPAVPEAAEHASVESAERSYAHEDGSLVIDILAGPACGTSSTDEIVVCAPDGSEHRLPASIPPPPPAQGSQPALPIAPNAT